MERIYVMTKDVSFRNLILHKGDLLTHAYTFKSGDLELIDRDGTAWIIKPDEAQLAPQLNAREPFYGLDWIDVLLTDSVAYWCPICDTVIFTPTENLFYGVEQPQDCPLCETPMWVHPPKGE